jgi:DNA-directed RNA polymerase specialized sigma24 family protein
VDTADAIERLYRERGPAFVRLAAAVAGPDAAVDAVQEGFARAYARRRSYRGEGSLGGWVWRIVLRAALDAKGVGRDLPLDEALEPSLPFPARDPDLHEALRALAPRRRLVVFLRYYAGMSLAEIAEVTGIAVGTVSATLAQAKTQLAAALAPEEVER